jgi:hypothetical protein
MVNFHQNKNMIDEISIVQTLPFVNPLYRFPLSGGEAPASLSNIAKEVHLQLFPTDLLYTF